MPGPDEGGCCPAILPVTLPLMAGYGGQSGVCVAPSASQVFQGTIWTPAPDLRPSTLLPAGDLAMDTRAIPPPLSMVTR